MGDSIPILGYIAMAGPEDTVSKSDERTSYEAAAKVREAVQHLSIAEKARLHAAATYFCNKLNGHSAEDLVQEAIVRALSGTRRFPPIDNPGCDFVVFLFGTMQSIADIWKGSPYEHSRVNGTTTEDNDHSFWENLPSESVTPEAEVIRQELIQLLKRQLPMEHGQVIDAQLKGYTGPEIESIFGLTRIKLETICRRVQRTVKAMREAVL